MIFMEKFTKVQNEYNLSEDPGWLQAQKNIKLQFFGFVDKNQLEVYFRSI